MIRVYRPEKAPDKLLEEQTTALTAELCRRYDADPTVYKSGSVRFTQVDFESSVYGHPSVKTALKKAQHGKCAWCERKPEGGGGSHGDVEHYRPKGSVKQDDGAAELRPGYYWLAYAWTNLLYSCQKCNQSFKRTLFPLVSPAHRARSHHDTLETEEPLLIDPANPKDDPRRHIVFPKDVPVGLTAAGWRTIEVLELDRDPDEVRAKHWRLLADCLRAAEQLEAIEAVAAADLREHLHRSARADAPFSAMVQDLLKSQNYNEK